mgnify:CR=1 FL=1
MKNTVLFLFAVCLSASTLSAPFGIEMGMSIEDVDKNASLNDSGKLYDVKPPKPHSLFEHYTIEATKQHGVCASKGLSKDIDTSVYGTELKSKYSELKAALSSKYGEPYKSFDFLKHGSLWSESNYWMISLLKKERRLASFWVKNLPDGMTVIMLTTHAISTNKGVLSLSTEFKNRDQCQKVINQTDNNSL